jgi:hypothetical protein
MSSSSDGLPDSSVGVTSAPTDAMEIMLAILQCTMEGRDAVYISAPITTGRRFVAWRTGLGATLSPSGEEYHLQHRTHVILPNLKHVRPVVRRIRQHFGGVVIDPTALKDIPGWVQEDYHSFWTEVVERCARAVVFTEGWEYSRGCAHEFLAALRSGALLLQEDLTPLEPSAGAQLIERAVASVDDAVIPTPPLVRVVDEVRALLGKDARTNSDAMRAQ